MDDTRKCIEEFRQALSMNKIKCEEIAKRLTIAIEAEYLKESPCVDFINACEDFLWELGTQGQQPFTSANQQYLAAIHSATTEHKAPALGKTMISRFVAIAVSLLLIIVLGHNALRVQWFTQKTHPEGDIHIVQGHEISIELIQSALADHDAHSSMKTSAFLELCDFLGFTPTLLLPEAISACCATYYVTVEPGLIVLDTLYNDQLGNSVAVLKNEYYLDPEEANFMLQQDAPGEYIDINGYTIYCSTNIDRQSFTWLENSTLITLSGYIERECGIQIVTEMIRRNTHD